MEADSVGAHSLGSRGERELKLLPYTPWIPLGQEAGDKMQADPASNKKQLLEVTEGLKMSQWNHRVDSVQHNARELIA